MAVTLNASTSTGYIQSADTSGVIALQNNGTTAMTVESVSAGSPTVSIRATTTTGTTLGNKNNRLLLTSDTGTVNAGGEIVFATDDTATGRWAAISGATQSNSVSGAYGNLLFATKATEAATTLTTRLYIGSNGKVLVQAIDNGAYNLQCNGTGVWGAGAYVNGSDERIKENIAPLASGLDVITKLNPVTYRYKADWSNDQSIQPGFIAQEMLAAMEGKEYVDGVVTQGGDAGYYSVAYQNVIPLLTKAIQEQQAMIEELKAEVAALKRGA